MGKLTRWTSLVVLAIFLCHLQSSAACSCPQVHPQSYFCHSDFVALVTVEEFTTVNEAANIAAYKVNVNQTFKANPSARIALDQKPVRLWTRSEGSLCGLVNLQIGETYVVGGHMDGSEAHVELCGLSEQWSYLTPNQQDGFQKLYQDGCDCEVMDHYIEDTNGCWWNVYYKGNCQERYGVCLRGSGRCSWTPSVEYDKCVKTHHIVFTFDE